MLIRKSRKKTGNKNQAENITSYENTKVAIEADSPSQGILFLSDTYYPGWKAFIDGREVPVYRANYAFRAVVFPQGRHTVEFIYRPRSFFLGGAISLIALSFGIVFCYLSLRRNNLKSV